MLLGLEMCGAIAPRPDVPCCCALCFTHYSAYLLRCKEGVLAVSEQGQRVWLFAYIMGSDP